MAAITYSPPSHIAILNKSSGLDDGECALWIEAYREEIKRVADAWGLAPPGLALYPDGHTEEPDKDVAAIYIVNSANEPDALGYHTAVGRSRFGYVDMELSADYDIPSVVFGHELYELFVDADVDRWAGPIDGVYYAVEVCDPCQRNYYPHDAVFMGNRQAVRCADFIYPNWFDPGDVGPYSYRNSPASPLTDAPGGYHITERNGVIVTGSARVASGKRTLRRLMGRPRDIHTGK